MDFENEKKASPGYDGEESGNNTEAGEVINVSGHVQELDRRHVDYAYILQLLCSTC